AVGITGLWLARRVKYRWAVRLRYIVAGVAAVATVAIILLHFNYSLPLLARHPTGSLTGPSPMLLMFAAVRNLSTAAESELPRVSWLTTVLAMLGLVVATTSGVMLFHYDMQEVRSRGIEATSTVSASRAVLGREQVNLLLRLAERWERYPPGIHD